MKFRPGHLYVAIGRKGLTKVGMSSNPEQRKKFLIYEFRKLDDEIEKFVVTEFIDCWFSVYEYEKKLIAFAGSLPGSEVAKGVEFFYNVDAESCISMAHELASEAVNAGEERKRWQIESAKRRKEEKRLVDEKKQQKANNLKMMHFEEFLDMQRSGLIPIPKVTNAAAS